jgi:hypothetical protein
LGRLSLEYILGGLALKLTLSEDAEQLERVRPMLQKREALDWRPKVPAAELGEERPWPWGVEFPSKAMIKENIELRRQVRKLQNERDELAKAVAAIPPLPPPSPRKPQRHKKARRDVRFGAGRSRVRALAAALG